MSSNYIIQPNIVEEHLRSNRPHWFDYIDANEADKYNHAFWINDLLFVVPPSRISIDTDYNIFQWKSLRSDTSVKVHSGNSNTYIKVDLIMPSGNSVINVNYNKPTSTAMRGGLLDLILQFKYTPFCYIENAFVRSNIGLDVNFNMAATLHQLSVSTMQGFPGTLQVEILLGVFNYRPYGPNFCYKDQWNVEYAHGGARFESANPSFLSTDPPDIMDAHFAPGVNAFDLCQTSRTMNKNDGPPMDDMLNPISLNSIPIAENNGSTGYIPFQDTWTFEDLQDQDRILFVTPEHTHTPAWSEVYTSYINWLRTQWEQKGFGDLQPIGSRDHDLGDKLRFKWKTYQKFEMPDDVYRELVDAVKAELQSRANAFQDYIPPSSRGTVNLPFTLSSDLASFNDDISDPTDEEFHNDDMVHYLTRHVEAKDFDHTDILEIDNFYDRGQSGNRLPPRNEWANYIPALRILAYLRRYTGLNIELAPTQYDTNHLGSSTSTHGFFQALELGISGLDQPQRHMVARALLAIYESSAADDLQFGFGIYTTDDHFTDGKSIANYNLNSYMHIDTGKDKRRWFWNDTNEHYVDIYGRQSRTNLFNAFKNDFPLSLATEDLRTNEQLEDDMSDTNSQPTPPAEIPEVAHNEEPEMSNTAAAAETLGRIRGQTPLYDAWVSNIERSGYRHYNQDISVYDVFYTPNNLIVHCSSDTREPGNHESICNQISSQLSNIFASIPLNGHITPTAQFLGGMDTGFNISILCNGLAQLQQIQKMKQTLESQAVNFRFIPDSWSVEVKNPLIQAFGHNILVFTSISSDTVQGNPGLYHVELEASGHKPYHQQEQIEYQGANNPEAILRAFFQDILNLNIITRRTENGPVIIDENGIPIIVNGSDAASTTQAVSTILNRLFADSADNTRLSPTFRLDRSVLTIDFSNIEGAQTSIEELRYALYKLFMVLNHINMSLLTTGNDTAVQGDYLGLNGSDSLIFRAGDGYLDKIVLGLIREDTTENI